MKVVQLAWLLTFLATTGAQKASKVPKQPKGAEVSSHYGGGVGQAGPHYGGNQYAYVPSQSSHGGHGGHGQGGQHAHGAYSAAPAAKATYPLLLSDSRTLNQDGTINFQYAADNGLQQGESVDPDGTRRGFYSYPGADGKPITVKYTAGKHGFRAEGDHLPRQPDVPQHSGKEEEVAYKEKSPVSYGGHGGQHGSHSQQHGGHGQQHGGHSPHGGHRSHGGGHGGHGGVPQGHGGHAGAHYGNPAGPYAGLQARPQSYGGSDLYTNPKPYSAGPGPNSIGGAYGGGHRGSHYSGPPAYSSGHGGRGHGGGGGFEGFGGPGAGAFKDFGPVNYGAPSLGAAPQTQYATHALPASSGHGQSYGGFGGGAGGGRGPVHSAINPYTHSSGAGPYAGNFDLGNGGQFSIDFNPGKSQEVPIGGDYGGHLQSHGRSPSY